MRANLTLQRPNQNYDKLEIKAGYKQMLSNPEAYKTEMLNEFALTETSETELTEALEEYQQKYGDCFTKPQIRYFEAFVKGSLSSLDRKSAEPIALHFMGEKQVRGLQNFFSRSTGWDEKLLQSYQKQLSNELSTEDGFISVDECGFVKKGAESVGVARQYCGTVGKRENSQSGVFVSYASEKGYGIVDRKLYMPEKWFTDSFAEKRDTCQVPEDVTFQTKNKMASQMLSDIINDGKFSIKWVGCDAAFGSDHSFLDGLPKSVYYFAAVKEKEYIFLSMPEVAIPESKKQGGKFKHPRALTAPVHINTIASDDSIPWKTRIIANGAKGPVIADIKCVRCVASRKVNKNLTFIPGDEIWVYIRRYEDGVIKYFISNAPADTTFETLDKLATMRWSIEQCFQECKSFLGMDHYETRSYAAWHRHMLLVMVAHLFTICLRNSLKKKESF